MTRLTISLPEELHKALKEAAARRGRTMGELVEESLRFYGLKSEKEAQRLVERARAMADLDEEHAVEVAVAEARQTRGRR